MKAIYINPFIKATLSLFTDYLGLTVENGEPYLNKSPKYLHDVSAIIGLAGETRGAIVLSFERKAAIKVAEKFVGKQFIGITNELIDCIGEVVNIVAGNAKRDLEDFRIDISLPGVVTGKKHQIAWPSDIPVITIPFSSSFGNFSLNVSLKEQ